MGRTIINIFEMGELIRAGKKTSQIAQHFGVTDREVLKTKLNGEGEEVEEIIADLKLLVITRPATIEQLFKAQAEIRQQIGLVVKVAAELLEARRVQEVHQIMMEEIGVESPECQGRIVRRLQG